MTGRSTIDNPLEMPQNTAEKSYIITGDTKITDSAAYEILINGASRGDSLQIKGMKIKSYAKAIAIKHDLDFKEGYFTDVGYGKLHYCELFDYGEESCNGEWIFIKDIAGIYRQELLNGAFAIGN